MGAVPQAVLDLSKGITYGTIVGTGFGTLGSRENSVSESHEKGQGKKRPASAGYSVPEAGAMVGLSRNGSYEAARRGEIPVLKFGSKRVVPKAVWDRKLGLTQ
jgi:hypothetical protein